MSLHKFMEKKNMPKICNLSIYRHLLILALFLITSQRHFLILFPKEMDGLIDFLLLRVFRLTTFKKYQTISDINYFSLHTHFKS